jgi:hypothetical protein
MDEPLKCPSLMLDDKRLKNDELRTPYTLLQKNVNKEGLIYVGFLQDST